MTTPASWAGSRLPPPSGRLLPPGGSLPPPAMADKIKPADPSFDAARRDREDALRLARGRVQALGQRAFEAAAARAPELRRQAVTAAGIASVHAGRTARQAAGRTGSAAKAAQAAWSAGAEIPGRRRLWLLGVGGALAVLAALLWVAAQQHATAVARQRVAQILNSTGLRGVVLYRALSASPFGAVTLHDVTLRLEPLLVPISTVTLDGIVDAPDGLTAGTITLRGAVVPVVAIARSGMLASWPAGLLGLGVTTARLDASARFTTDDTAQSLTADASVSDHDVGSAHATIHLGGVDTQRLGGMIRLVRTLQASEASGFGSDPGNSLRQLQALLTDLSWQGGALTLNDAPLRARAHAVTARSVPGDQAGDTDLIGPVARLPADAFVAVLPSDEAQAAQARVQSWLDDGGRLVIRSDPPTPIGVFRQRGNMEGLAPALDASTLSAAGLRISD